MFSFPAAYVELAENELLLYSDDRISHIAAAGDGGKDRFRIKMIGRLVQQQKVGPGDFFRAVGGLHPNVELGGVEW